MSRINLSLLLVVLILHNISFAQTNAHCQWPMYRGFYASGVLDDANLPESWNVEEDINIAWKTPMPGLGHSCPIVWNEKVFVTTAVSDEDKGEVKAGVYGSIQPVPDSSMHRWILYCIDKNTGKIKWEQTAYEGIPKQKRHPMSSHANCTPATNGKYVVAFFGSEGLYCYDMNGNLQWSKDFGVLISNFFLVEDAEWEFASSPLIHENVVIIQADVYKNSFLAAYDLATGKELWKQERDEYPGWCTPNIYKDGDKTRVVVNGYKHRGGYDFFTGEEIWRMSGGGDIQVPTPIVANNLVYFNSAHGKFSPVMAVKTDATGDITLEEKETSNKGIQWYHPRGGSYMGTMLVYGDYLYNAAWNGKLTCYNALTGEVIYSEKAGKGNSYTASPVAADGVIYIGDNDGNIYSIQAGPKYKLLQTNKLGETLMSTPAIAEDYLFFKTIGHLVAVSGK
ncbi:PQQ-binding-like beta-propeller repeat protein [uncultured Draconibacterium sp.]|uniref:outer membrane protein assembly factor BamB family protein n=1 Tax=uncultured Draconibacterium sp. TaxID=1573823 RepID=UPI0025D5CD61|nr:PQQ-binding-like beta-propeller repeat protein [uncultured Draconibacterium sp.]